jgi:metallo-beta-lactamase family protein
MKVQLTFEGAAGTVTGSKSLLTRGPKGVLVDAGLFQGLKRLRLRNWAKPGYDPKKIESVLLTHCHLDHSGWLPRLVSLGFQGHVFATPATIDLCAILLADSARLQEEDAEYANRKGFSKHKPALPLYTEAEAEKAVRRMRPVEFDVWTDVADGIRARWHNSGHILGAAFIELKINAGDEEIGVVFSGDLGRYDVPLHIDPEPRPACDVLVIESTYGNRTHTHVDLDTQFIDVFGETLERGGVVLIPAFAVGRSQLLALVLRRLMKAGRLPKVPIHVDSPMATRATAVYSKYLDAQNVDEDVFEDGRRRLFPDTVKLHVSAAESKRLNELDGPFVLIAGSGMLSGGRILHHIRQRGGDPKNLLCLSGYQAEGTRGRHLIEGTRKLRIHGRDYPIRAQVTTLKGLSGHADADELMRWVSGAPTTPSAIFVNHGEPKSIDALAKRLHEETGAWTHPAALNERFDLASLVRKGK